MNVAQHIVERLRAWGVHRVYGYPGDGIGGVLVALGEQDDGFEFIQVRHEETAGFAATADVKYGGSPIGCCVVTSGPGALHALNGMYDALMDRVPVVAVLGQTAVSALGGNYYQEVDLHSVYKDVGRAYIQTITDAAQVEHMVDRACRTALAAKAPTVLIVASDARQWPSPPTPTPTSTPAPRPASRSPHRIRPPSRPAPTCSTRASALPCWSGPAPSVTATSWNRWPIDSEPAPPRPCWARRPWTTNWPG